MQTIARRKVGHLRTDTVASRCSPQPRSTLAHAAHWPSAMRCPHEGRLRWRTQPPSALCPPHTLTHDTAREFTKPRRLAVVAHASRSDPAQPRWQTPLLTRCAPASVARSLPCSRPSSFAPTRPWTALSSRNTSRSVTCALTDSLHDAPPVHEAHWPTQLTHQVRRAPLTKPRRLALVTRASRLGRAQPQCGARTAHSLRPCLGGSRSRLAPFLLRSGVAAADADDSEKKGRSPAH